MAKIQLTNEEKIIKKYYNQIVNKKRLMGTSKAELMRFCQAYIDEVLKNTRFEEERIQIQDETNPHNAGSMRTRPNGQTSILTINFETLLSKKRLNSRDDTMRFKHFVDIVDTLNHETQHYFQNKEVENFKVTSNGMSFANCLEIIREELGAATDRNKFYGSEEGNYADLYIEGDARRTGSIKTSTQLLRIAPDMPLKRKGYLINRVRNSIKKDNVEFNKLKYDGSARKYDRGDVASAYVDEYVAAHPKILEEKEYSALTFEYDTDGSRFAFEEVLEIRDDVEEAIRANQKIKESTRENLFKQVNAGFSQIMYNALTRSSEEKIIDIRRRIGDKQFIKELDYIHNGKLNEVNEKVQKYSQYVEFFQANGKILKKESLKDISKELDEIYANSGYEIKIDSVTGKKYATINSTQIEYIKKLGNKVLETKDQYPRYTPEELKESNRKREVAKQKYKEQMANEFLQRKFEQIKKEEREEIIRQEQERARQEEARKEHERKMKNPFYRAKYNAEQFIKNMGKKKLPQSQSGKHSKELLFSKKEEVTALYKEKNDLEENLSEIEAQVKDTLQLAEEKIYLDKQEKAEKENNTKGAQDIGKGSI